MFCLLFCFFSYFYLLAFSFVFTFFLINIRFCFIYSCCSCNFLLSLFSLLKSFYDFNELHTYFFLLFQYVFYYMLCIYTHKLIYFFHFYVVKYIIFYQYVVHVTCLWCIVLRYSTWKSKQNSIGCALFSMIKSIWCVLMVINIIGSHQSMYRRKAVAQLKHFNTLFFFWGGKIILAEIFKNFGWPVAFPVALS